MQPLGITQDALARALGISRRRVNELVRGRRAITPDTALRLALLFGLEPAFWLGLQMQWDLYAERRLPLSEPRRPRVWADLAAHGS